ncbi:hypothetical protein ISS22_16115 [candidate division KSB1 bacterium]|nr:hypothetical protein [candidate division KSB1 bacterium]
MILVTGYPQPYSASSGTSAILLVRRLFGGFLGGYQASFQIPVPCPENNITQTGNLS